MEKRRKNTNSEKYNIKMLTTYVYPPTSAQLSENKSLFLPKPGQEVRTNFKMAVAGTYGQAALS